MGFPGAPRPEVPQLLLLRNHSRLSSILALYNRTSRAHDTKFSITYTFFRESPDAFYWTL